MSTYLHEAQYGCQHAHIYHIWTSRCMHNCIITPYFWHKIKRHNLRICKQCMYVQNAYLYNDNMWSLLTHTVSAFNQIDFINIIII